MPKDKAKSMFKYFNKISMTNISWWERLLLLFKKPRYGFDVGARDDKSVLITAKEMFGKIYIVDEKVL